MNIVPTLTRGPLILLTALILGMFATACTPTVQIAPSNEPITVNLNVKIQHEIFVKVDKDVDALFDDGGLF